MQPWGSDAQTVEIIDVPVFGQSGSIEGNVTGVNFATHRVAPYIYIDGIGWWTKPTFASPTVSINTDGSFSAFVTTGGLDRWATIFCAALLPAGALPAPAASSVRVPPDPDFIAIDCSERYGRILEFAGYSWAVKTNPGAVDPGGNRFSDNTEDVFVDDDGRLHLTINFHDGYWWATEVVLLDRLGFGTYGFQTDSRVDILDVNATFGAFTWDPYGDEETVPNNPNREIDFEDTRWGQWTDVTNAQMVVQSHAIPGNLRRYTIPDLSANAALTRLFNWESEQIEFVALHGKHSACLFPDDAIIDDYVYDHDSSLNHFVPTEGREQFRFNLWLNNVALGPDENLPIEVVITDFTFTSACDGDNDGDGVADGEDNCTVAANPDQRDTDGDGYGQICDGDLNNDGETDPFDLNMYRTSHRTCAGDPNYNVEADFNGDGCINTLDLSILKGLYRKPPGPSCCGV